MVSWLSLLLGTSIGAGANAYLTLLAVGLYARFGEGTPEVQEAIAPFGSYWVLAPAGVLFLVEFFADKVPALDNLWDALHTIVRPVAAVFIALTLARDIEIAYQLMAAMGAGSIALGTHGFKAGLRGLARLNPEPASNALSSSGLSLAEDLSVAGLLALVFAFPGVALVLIGALLMVMVVVGPRLARLAIFAFRASATRLLAPFRSGRARPYGAGPPPAPVLAAIRRKHDGFAVKWWLRCYVDRRDFFDYRYGFLVVGREHLVIVFRSFLRRRVDFVTLDTIEKGVVRRGPLVHRISLDTTAGQKRVLVLASERESMDLLVSTLRDGGVSIDKGRREGATSTAEECAPIEEPRDKRSAAAH